MDGNGCHCQMSLSRIRELGSSIFGDQGLDFRGKVRDVGKALSIILGTKKNIKNTDILSKISYKAILKRYFNTFYILSIFIYF